jgi:hypothetical protein
MHSCRTILPGWGGFFIGMFALLVVVDQIDVGDRAVIDAEHDPPMWPNA